MRCAVIGSPVAHSLSPAMHRAAYRALGLDWTYEAVEVAEGTLATFVRALGDDVRGLSVTAPLKREAASVADHGSADVELLGVANTLVVEDGILLAANTDVGGIVAALAERGLANLATIRILGAGATAVSVAHALASRGARQVELVVREPSRAAHATAAARAAGADVIVRELDEQLTETVDLLVSTVPANAIGPRATELVGAARAVFDVVYDPWPTDLAVAAGAASVPLVSGLDLLAHQAALQVGLMTGQVVSAQMLRDSALAELAAR